MCLLVFSSGVIAEGEQCVRDHYRRCRKRKIAENSGSVDWGTMLFITDKPVSMNEWKETHRADVEKGCARKSSKEDVEILSQSMEANQAAVEGMKSRVPPPQVKGGRIRRHSSYEPNLDDILEDEEQKAKGRVQSRNLAEIHRERARDSGFLKRDREGRTWRRRHFVNNNCPRARSYTA